ncbi:hypothetical protein [Salana multivorans]
MFRAEGRDGLGRLDTDLARLRVSSALALYLTTFPAIEVSYDNVRLDPAASIEQSIDLDLGWEHEGTKHKAVLRVVEWRDVKGSTLFLCDEQGVPVDEAKPPRFTDFSFGAMIRTCGWPSAG